MARKTGNIQSSQNSIELLHKVVNEENELHNLKLYNRLILEEAKILWNQEENTLAINMIRKHINDISSNNLIFSSMNNEEYANEKNEILYQLLSHLGHWIGIQRLENPAFIIENYMEKAVKIMEDGHMKSSEVYFKFADYSNSQYQIMCQPDICVQQKLLSYKEKELEALNLSIKTTKSTTERNKFEIQKRRIETQIELDKSEINRVAQTQEIFLIKAIENYLKTLVHSDQYDICVFRLIALWFKNKYNTLINQYIYKYIKIIESRKFLTLIYQLSARMSLANADKKVKYFVLTVNALIQKMIIDHPYHCLYQIIALRNGDILSSSDIQYFSSPEKRKQHLNSGIINKQTMLRIQAASAMLNSVMKHRPLAQLIKDVEFLSEAYIELAALKFSANDRKKLINNKKPITFSSKLKLSKIGALERVPISTKTLPIDPTCEYKNIVYIQGYKPSFQLIGGINLPKVLECMGNDGKIYKQLVKGSDDLRQDAVLTKIFNLVNVLLKKNQSTRKRQLSIRTYNIIPLSPRSGIIEWVQNTIPFGTYLNEAHPKYNKEDILPLECRVMLHNEQQRKNSTPKTKLAIYNSIVEQFKPVFRFFFQEKFKDPFDWYNKKISYTKSVSVNSVTGWVVGLGDRHCMNILIDVKTAEAIHIDLGIAFDTGKLLSIPECIPFRLTRDVVDGMGINKVEGVFRKCCEETLKVLRKNSNILLTILDVFRYDPLYNWTISPLKMARQVQETNNLPNEMMMNPMEQEDLPMKVNPAHPTTSESESGMDSSSENKNNDDIERAFLGVKSKLSEQMSVACQINELIEMAMNPENLSRLFPGWQPYM